MRQIYFSIHILKLGQKHIAWTAFLFSLKYGAWVGGGEGGGLGSWDDSILFFMLNILNCSFCFSS